MPRTIGPIVETLLQRVRQAGGFAISPDMAVKVYSRSEQLVNSATGRVTAITSVSLPKQKLLYSIKDILPLALRIKDVHLSGVELLPCRSFDDLSALDKSWFRNITGTSPQAWLQVGDDLLFIYPGCVGITAVSIEYVKLLTYYDNFDQYYNTESELPDEDIDLALGVAEVVLLLRFRLVLTVKSRLDALAKLLSQKGVVMP